MLFRSVVASLVLTVSLFVSPATACSVCEALAAQNCGSMASDAPKAPFANFTLQGSQWSQPGGDGTPVTVTYSYNNFLDGGLKDLMGVSVSAEYLRLVTYEAFALWASVAPLHFVEVPDAGGPYDEFGDPLDVYYNIGAYNALPASGFGQIRLHHTFINGTDAQNGFPTTKALAYFPSGFSNISGDVFFDNGDPWEVIGTPSEPDVLGILVHELGHSLGINHSEIDGAVMFPRALRRMGPGTGILTADDIAAVRAIYGAGVGSVTPLIPIPEPATAGIVALFAAWVWLPASRRRG